MNVGRLRKGIVDVEPVTIPASAPASAQHATGRAAGRTWLQCLLAENASLIVLVAGLGALLLLVSPALLVADSWLALVSGREIVQHGLPSHDALVVLTHGTRWVDQQWLAQLFFYGAWALGGLRLAVILNVVLVVAAIGSGVLAARLRGASSASVLVVSAVCLFVAPWSWQLRPQVLALPLFVWTVFLLTQDVRHPARRTFLVFPILVLWANLHGTVVLAAVLTALAGVAAIARDRRITQRAAAFVLLPWPCVLASPYAWHLPGYYRLMLVDPPFARFVSEWQPARPSAVTAMFYLLLAATILLVVRQRRRFTLYELATLGLACVEAVHAVRAIAWFVLAALVLLPSALDGTFRHRRQLRRHPLARPSALVALTAFLVSLVIAAGRSDGSYQRYWPEAAVAAVAEQPQTTKVFPSDRYGDWLFWRIPSLRGRIAYDVRFELLDRRELNALFRYSRMRGQSWPSVTDGYGVVVLDLPKRRAQLRALLARPGFQLAYEKKDDIAVLVNSCARLANAAKSCRS